MRRTLLLSLCALSMVAFGCTSGGPMTADAGDSGTGIPPNADSDADGILDIHEGRAERVDTDGDGIEDWEDTDSDGDGIPDFVEAGDRDLATPPIDSDMDLTPDFRDTDSDDNGISDADEGSGDNDADGIPDFADLDDDNDFANDVSEINGIYDPFVDSDADGIPNYLDPDSDNDTIMDGDEIGRDTDRDGLFDHEDLDSDNDTIPDSIEAGDADLRSPPVDSDGDMIPDFRDPDSDGDGLSDRYEAEIGTDPTRADSDNDGVDDLIEAGAGTDPLDTRDNPRTRGDFVFVVRYMEPPDPARDTLGFATNIQKADVYFLMDETGSMGGTITSLQAEIRDTLIPRIRMVIPQTWIGIGGFRDYPTGGYGSSGDQPFAHYQDVTDDEAAAQAATSNYRASGGADGAESHVPAMWAVATGMGLSTGGASVPPRSTWSPDPCGGDRFGYPCFRADAVPIIVLLTDIYMHNGPTGGYPYSGFTSPSYSETLTALLDRDVRVIGIAANAFGADAVRDLEAVARDTGAVDGTGTPLVSTWMSGSSIADEIVGNIQILAEQTRFDISVDFRDDPTDEVDTGVAFLDHLEANQRGDAARRCTALAAEDREGADGMPGMDGIPDTFPRVLAGVRVCFDIFVKQNDTVEPTTDEPRIYQATLVVLGDGFTPLDERVIFFLVPPPPPEIEIPI